MWAPGYPGCASEINLFVAIFVVITFRNRNVRIPIWLENGSNYDDPEGLSKLYTRTLNFFKTYVIVGTRVPGCSHKG